MGGRSESQKLDQTRNVWRGVISRSKSSALFPKFALTSLVAWLHPGGLVQKRAHCEDDLRTTLITSLERPPCQNIKQKSDEERSPKSTENMVQ